MLQSRIYRLERKKSDFAKEMSKEEFERAVAQEIGMMILADNKTYFPNWPVYNIRLDIMVTNLTTADGD